MNTKVKSNHSIDLSVGAGIAIADIWLSAALLSAFTIVIALKFGFFYEAFRDITSIFEPISGSGPTDLITISIAVTMIFLAALMTIVAPLFLASSITVRIFAKDF